jgi:uncharacterized protein (TIGR03435 family)
VASSKGRTSLDFLPSRQRFAATSASFAALILTVLSKRYDIQAKADHEASRSQMLVLLQSLLEDRFRLVVRWQTKKLPPYALMLDKASPKLQASDAHHIISDAAAPLNPYRA